MHVTTTHTKRIEIGEGVERIAFTLETDADEAPVAIILADGVVMPAANLLRIAAAIHEAIAFHGANGAAYVCADHGLHGQYTCDRCPKPVPERCGDADPDHPERECEREPHPSDPDAHDWAVAPTGAPRFDSATAADDDVQF